MNRGGPAWVGWEWLPLLGLLLALGLAGCKPSGKAGKPAERVVEVPVEVEPVRLGLIESTLRTFATLEAEQEVKVFARTANRVTELRVEEGVEVDAEEVLVRLEDTDQRVRVAKAENALEKMRREYERLEALHAQSLVSDQVFTDARFELRQLELALEEAQRELGHTEVRAPLAGVVTRRLVKLGDLVTAGQHLFDVVDFGSIVARIHVPEKELVQLETNQAARVAATALAGREFEGRIRRIAPVVDAKTGTVKVTLGFESVGPLRPGMYVDVELILSRKADAVLLSKRALVLDGDQTYAFRLGDDRTVRRLLVEARASDRFHVEPREGFEAGDRVVVAGQTGLKDGARVRLPEDGEGGGTNGTTSAVAGGGGGGGGRKS